MWANSNRGGSSEEEQIPRMSSWKTTYIAHLWTEKLYHDLENTTSHWMHAGKCSVSPAYNGVQRCYAQMCGNIQNVLVKWRFSIQIREMRLDKDNLNKFTFIQVSWNQKWPTVSLAAWEGQLKLPDNEISRKSLSLPSHLRWDKFSVSSSALSWIWGLPMDEFIILDERKNMYIKCKKNINKF